MKIFWSVGLFFVILFLSACSAPEAKPVEVGSFTDRSKPVSYLDEVQPLLDKRCVVCHSCYNAPCQAKYSAFEGVERGASKQLVYDGARLSAISPTRLFIDAQTAQQWRQKGFYSLIDNSEQNRSLNNSILLELVHHKMEHPEIIGSYDPEHETWRCPRNSKELGAYFEDKPHHGMPYGFPALEKSEYMTLTKWLSQGAIGPSNVEQKALITPSAKVQNDITKWEQFLNKPDPKHSVTARYLYEHFYLAHISFKSSPLEFFELVRSTTPPDEPIDLIPSLRPFDDPGVTQFYYRFRKYHASIVHKTHMVLSFDDSVLARYKELFIKPVWTEKPHYVDFESKSSANPFVKFFQIPVKSRYQFLLDNSHYIVMTFIRGPVCRGQMALNVIHDHFWVMFLDPKADLSVQYPGFLLTQAHNLELPIESRSQNVLETFSDAYRERYGAYFKAKEALYDKTYPQGLGLESIWRGNKAEDAPVLTVYRHFNSASVHKGVLGELPRTMWVIDYPQFERIYYSLVAGYDVFGNISHQTNIRRYMDFLRLEGEVNFVSYLPKDERLQTLRSWYIGDEDFSDKFTKDDITRGTGIVYQTSHHKQELIEQVVKKQLNPACGIGFDPRNYFKAGEKIPPMPTSFMTSADLFQGVRALSKPGLGFVQYVTDGGVNNALIRVKMPDGSDLVRSLVINRWHDNVNSMFSESSRLNSSKDTLDVLEGSIGSYPNMFIVVDYTQLPDFFDLLEHFDGSELYMKKIKKYFISRSDPNFWQTYDWFQDHFDKNDPLRSGRYDLNRYYRFGFE